MSDKSHYTYIYIYLQKMDEHVNYLHLEQAINASCKNPYGRVEIFVTNCAYPGYEPTYDFYKGCILYKNGENVSNE